MSEAQARERAIALLQEAGIQGARARIDSYPHEFSGGMRQRVVLALALCAEPELLIADEPTTALDVSIQAQIIALLKRLCRERGTAVMLITHDMGVIAETADRVAVMYAGRIAEIGPVRDVVQAPAPPLHQGPDGGDPDAGRPPSRLVQIPGSMPRLDAIPQGLRLPPPLRACLRPLPHRAAGARCRPGSSRRRAGWSPTNAAGGAGMTGAMAAPLVEAQGPHARVRRLQALAQPRHRGRAQGLPEGGDRRLLRHRPARDAGAGGRIGLGQVDGGAHGGRPAARRRPARVTIDGIDMWAPARAAERQKLRRRLQMIFQDPYASLNPRWRVDRIIADPIKAFGLAKDEAEIEHRVGELLTLVGLDPADGAKYPHEFSGGQRQRICIARALSSNPEFIVCDEPTSALDVSVQAQILNLMRDLQDRLGLSYLFISHNLAVVRHMATRIGVMYLGRIVEHGAGGGAVRLPAPPLYAPADGRAARPRHERAAAPADRGRDPQPDRAAAGLRLPSALPLGVRALPRRRAGAGRARGAGGGLSRHRGGAHLSRAAAGR